MLAIRGWRQLLMVLILGVGIFGFRVATTTAKDEPAAEENSDKPKRNPFVPRATLSAEELFEYIDRMMEAPRTVQSQEEYGPAMVRSACSPISPIIPTCRPSGVRALPASPPS